MGCTHFRLTLGSQLLRRLVVVRRGGGGVKASHQGPQTTNSPSPWLAITLLPWVSPSPEPHALPAPPWIATPAPVAVPAQHVGRKKGNHIGCSVLVDGFPAHSAQGGLHATWLLLQHTQR